MKDLSLEAVTVDSLNLSLFLEKQVQASILRLDKIHPHLSGKQSCKKEEKYFNHAFKRKKCKVLLWFANISAGM